MATLIERWEADSMELVQAALTYANGGTYDTDADLNIRKVRNLLPILAAAVGQASQVQRPPQQPQLAPVPQAAAGAKK
jgi:hypothetical protein